MSPASMRDSSKRSSIIALSARMCDCIEARYRRRVSSSTMSSSTDSTSSRSAVTGVRRSCETAATRLRRAASAASRRASSSPSRCAMASAAAASSPTSSRAVDAGVDVAAALADLAERVAHARRCPPPRRPPARSRRARDEPGRDDDRGHEQRVVARDEHQRGPDEHARSTSPTATAAASANCRRTPPRRRRRAASVWRGEQARRADRGDQQRGDETRRDAVVQPSRSRRSAAPTARTTSERVMG